MASAKRSIALYLPTTNQNAVSPEQTTLALSSSLPRSRVTVSTSSLATIKGETPFERGASYTAAFGDKLGTTRYISTIEEACLFGRHLTFSLVRAGKRKHTHTLVITGIKPVATMKRVGRNRPKIELSKK